MASSVATGRSSTLAELRRPREVSMRRLGAMDLNEHLFDVGITEVTQWEEKDETCEFFSSRLARDSVLEGGKEATSELANEEQTKLTAVFSSSSRRRNGRGDPARSS